MHLAQHLRMTGRGAVPSPTPSRQHVRVRHAAGGRRPAAVRDRRPAPLRHRRAAAGRARRWRRSSRRASASSRSTSASPPSTCARSRGGRTAPIKALLLDQRRIAGVGNIYADEALFRAGIHPRRAGRAPDARAVRAPARGGHRGAAGRDRRARRDDRRLPPRRRRARGSSRTEFLVHLREGEPCARCGATIVKMVVAGRGTYVCESCQPRPRRATARRP